MLTAGVGWSPTGYETAILAPDGPVGEVRRFRSVLDAVAHVATTRDDARRHGISFLAVIDSVTGCLDGHLRDKGVEVLRLDPAPGALHPERQRSHRALKLAAAGLHGKSASARLARITDDTGTVGERCDEVSGAWTWPRFGRGGPEVQLTFDDGPDPRFTPRILQRLRAYGVRATFYCVGLAVRAYPEIVDAMVQEGHAVENHTWSHPFLPDLSRDAVLWQALATGDAIETVTGRRPTRVRPPYGACSRPIQRWFEAEGLHPVLWDVEADDWSCPGYRTIVQRIVAGVRPGSIVLLHDAGGDRGQTVAALPEILEALLADGHSFTTTTAGAAA